MDKQIEALKEMIKIQCSPGNYNYDQYMYGMANGMIFALSLFDDKEPDYLEAPKKWLKDKYKWWKFWNNQRPIAVYEDDKCPDCEVDND